LLALSVGVAFLLIACAAEQPPEPAQEPHSPTAAQAVEAPPEKAPLAAPDLPQLDVSTFVEDDKAYAIGQLLPRDGIPPIYDPQFVAAEEATYFDDEMVIGVEINGEAKAYPITLLNSREMVDDELGGTPILVTW
jgi:hypothetical protein